MIKRAEKAGYKALVLTVDAPVFGIRYIDIKNNFSLPSHLKWVFFLHYSNYYIYHTCIILFIKFDRLGNFTEEKSVISKSDGSGLTSYVMSLFEEKLEWKDVKWLKR